MLRPNDLLLAEKIYILFSKQQYCVRVEHITEWSKPDGFQVRCRDLRSLFQQGPFCRINIYVNRYAYIYKYAYIYIFKYAHIYIYISIFLHLVDFMVNVRR